MRKIAQLYRSRQVAARNSYKTALAEARIQQRLNQIERIATRAAALPATDGRTVTERVHEVILKNRPNSRSILVNANGNTDVLEVNDHIPFQGEPCEPADALTEADTYGLDLPI